MASNADFVQYIADQCGGAGEIVAKQMFGDYGIYCNMQGTAGAETEEKTLVHEVLP
jgi:TfoX/Sxy family transcriptional regulator of competence genes